MIVIVMMMNMYEVTNSANVDVRCEYECELCV